MARLLVVGDESDLQDGLAHHLRQAGHHVISGESAPDLVLLVVKPFEVKELLPRVQAILHRTEEIEPIEFGLLRVDRASHRVWVGDAEVGLSSLELRLLCTLYDRRPRVQTRARLLDDVWGSGSDTGPRAVDTTVRRLREKLQSASAYLNTVHGAGYRFVETPDADTNL